MARQQAGFLPTLSWRARRSRYSVFMTLLSDDGLGGKSIFRRLDGLLPGSVQIEHILEWRHEGRRFKNEVISNFIRHYRGEPEFGRMQPGTEGGPNGTLRIVVGEVHDHFRHPGLSTLNCIDVEVFPFTGRTAEFR